MSGIGLISGSWDGTDFSIADLSRYDHFDKLRSDPSFQNLVRRVGLPRGCVDFRVDGFFRAGQYDIGGQRTRVSTSIPALIANKRLVEIGVIR